MLIDFTEIENDHVFENFAQNFLRNLGLKIIRNAAIGPDGGVDIICEQPNRYGQIGYRWLVSCKHYAHSGKSVGNSDDNANDQRLREYNCNGFMFVYSTAVTESLRQSVERVCQNTNASYKFFSPWEIENVIIQSPIMYPLMKQFFPVSHDRIIGKIGVNDVSCCSSGCYSDVYALYTKNRANGEIVVQVIGDCCRGMITEHLDETGQEWATYTLWSQ